MNRVTYSIASSWYNVEKMRFAWREALENWLSFLSNDGQLVIAINTSEDDSPTLVRDWVKKWQAEHLSSTTKIDIIDIAIPYTDPAFDGKGKAAAQAACTEPFVILLDCDERLVPSMRRAWDRLAVELDRSPYEAFLVPVVDLMGDEEHAKSAGAKWYLAKNLPHLTRGVVKHAWNEDGVSFRTDVSDSCELIHRETGELARTASIMAPGLSSYMIVAALEGGETPFVHHLGWLDYEQRLRQSAFWRPIWDQRAGTPGKEPSLALQTLHDMPRFRHSLPNWREGMR